MREFLLRAIAATNGRLAYLRGLLAACGDDPARMADLRAAIAANEALLASYHAQLASLPPPH